MELDPFVIDMFGPPPEGMDLSEIFMPGADALVISLGCIAALSVLLRFTARHVQNAGLEADDYLIVFALVRQYYLYLPTYSPASYQFGFWFFFLLGTLPINS